MRLVHVLLAALLSSGSVGGQNAWSVSYKDHDLQLDGYLDEWVDVPEIVISPNARGIDFTGDFGENDLNTNVRMLWDEQHLYLALRWEDDIWDIQEIGRHEAVWISPERRRRNRMLFFDYFSLQMRKADYDYTLWVSPRVEGRGPFMWHRLLEGLKGTEAATSPPMITPRLEDGTSTMEIFLRWIDLRVEPNENVTLPLTLLIADSDLPGRFLEAKLDQLKWLEWRGQIRLVKN